MEWRYNKTIANRAAMALDDLSPSMPKSASDAARQSHSMTASEIFRSMAHTDIDMLLEHDRYMLRTAEADHVTVYAKGTGGNGNIRQREIDAFERQGFQLRGAVASESTGIWERILVFVNVKTGK